jgi:hypothetical protein
MSSMLSTAPAVPADVAAFADEHDVSNPLLAVLSLTQRLFPSSAIAPRLEQDAEMENQWAIIVEVDVSGLEASQLVAAQRQWSEGLFACCPSTHAHLFFVLSGRFLESGGQIEQADSPVRKLFRLHATPSSRSDFFAEDEPLQSLPLVGVRRTTLLPIPRTTAAVH